MARLTPEHVYKMVAPHLVDLGYGKDPADSFHITPRALGFQILALLFTDPTALATKKPAHEPIPNPYTPWGASALTATIQRLPYFTPEHVCNSLLISAAHRLVTTP